VFTGDACRRHAFLQPLPNLPFIPISFGTIEVSEPSCYRVTAGPFCLGRVWNQRAEAQGRNRTGPVLEWYSRISKINRVIQFHNVTFPVFLECPPRLFSFQP